MKYTKIYLTLLMICSLAVSFAQTGEVQMKYHEYITPSLTQLRITLVWNTKTGQAVRYYYDADTDAWKKSTAAFPANPLGDNPSQTGEIMMDYHEYVTVNSRVQLRVILVWNTRTGQSARYYYDSDADTWNKSTASLPANPLGEKSAQVGEIMMDYNEYSTSNGGQNRMIMVWNTKTGKSARYYYDTDETWKLSTASLPASPLK